MHPNHKPLLRLKLWQIRVIYAVLSASCMCVIMSAFTTSILRDQREFWDVWPHVLSLDLLVAIPSAIVLGPLIRALIRRLTGETP